MMDTRGEGKALLKKALPFPLELPLPYPKTFILEGGRRDRGQEQTRGRRSPDRKVVMLIV